MRITVGILRSVSQAWRIGREIALCRKRNQIKNIPEAILTLQNGQRLFTGKIVNVHRVSFYASFSLCRELR